MFSIFHMFKKTKLFPEVQPVWSTLTSVCSGVTYEKVQVYLWHVHTTQYIHQCRQRQAPRSILTLQRHRKHEHDAPPTSQKHLANQMAKWSREQDYDAHTFLIKMQTKHHTVRCITELKTPGYSLHVVLLTTVSKQESLPLSQNPHTLMSQVIIKTRKISVGYSRSCI